MDPSHPDFQNFIINKIVIPDIIEQDQREYAAFAALLTLVNNQQESSDEYDSEYDYESGSGSKSREEEGEMPIIPERTLERSVVRKRPHSELNSRALPPKAPTPANKRVRIEDVAFASQPSNPPPANAEARSAAPQKSKTLYSPDEAICKINPQEPFALERATAITGVKAQFLGVGMEKARAIVATRFLNDAQAACKYTALKDDAKESFFNQLLREGFEMAFPGLAAAHAPAVPTAPPKEGGAKLTQQPKVEQERAKPVATPALKRDQVQVQVQSQTTRLKSDALKQVDARSQGKLEDRVRLWLDNIIPS